MSVYTSWLSLVLSGVCCILLNRFFKGSPVHLLPLSTGQTGQAPV